MANFEQMFLIHWRDQGRTLLDAFYLAVNECANESSVPPWDIRDVVARNPDGTGVLFLPQDCIAICGYGELRFNQFNLDADPW